MVIVQEHSHFSKLPIVLRQNFLEPDKTAIWYGYGAKTIVEVRIHKGDVSFVGNFHEECLLVDCVVKTVEIDEVNFLFIRFFQFTNPHGSGAHKIFGFVDEAV